MWRGAFFFGCLRLLLGTPEVSACAGGWGVDEEEEAGSLRRELKVDMNSIA